MYFRWFVAVALLVLALQPLSSAQASGNVTLYYFYGEGCPHCGRVASFMDGIAQKYPNLDLHKLEIYNNMENRRLLGSYFDAYGVPSDDRGVPTIFVFDYCIIGDAAIIENVEKLLKETRTDGAPSPSLDLKNPKIIGLTRTASAVEPEEISLFVLTSAALADSINPCAIAVLLILLNTLLAAGEKTRALKAGLAFILSIYIAYFLFGLGLMGAIQMSGFSSLFYVAVGVLAIVIGLFNIKDFVWYGGGGFVMEIPRSWRPKLKELLRSATSPLGAFGMGFIICLFELPCTGGPYLFILGLLAEKTTQAVAMPLLLYYNAIFVLPLIGIAILVYYGLATIEKAEKWKDRNLRLLHLATGLIMLALGIWALKGVVW